MQLQPQPNGNLLHECRIREFRAGQITVSSFKEALCAIVPGLDDSEFRTITRDIDIINGIIEYAKAIQVIDF